MEVFLREALLKARPQVRKASRQLADELEAHYEGAGHGRISLPHFWALLLHDGTRRRRVKRKGDLFVWFKNPRDDPRLVSGGRHPVHLEDVKELTEAQFLDGLRRNAELAAKGQPPFMIVTEFKRPRKGFFFFSKGMRGFGGVGSPIHRAAKDFIVEDLRKHLGFIRGGVNVL